MFASVPSAVLFCAEGHLIHVEVQVSGGLPGFSLVGLPDTSIRESRDRARAAVLSSGLPWPKHRITVNLAPSGDRKAGSGLDLAIAVGVLTASEVITAEAIEGIAFIGELGLDGSLRPVNGVAPMVGAVGERDVVVPIAERRPKRTSSPWAGSASWRTSASWSTRSVARRHGPTTTQPSASTSPRRPPPDLADVQGQPDRPTRPRGGSGRWPSHLVHRAAGRRQDDARLAAARPASAARTRSCARGHDDPLGVGHRPPGGRTGSRPTVPGAAPHVLAGLPRRRRFAVRSVPARCRSRMAACCSWTNSPSSRHRCSTGSANRSSRASSTSAASSIRAVLPADFLLVAAMNPCPCGGGAPGACVCGDAVLHRYARRVSGPLLDRFDLRVPVHRPEVDDLLVNEPGECSAVVAARVLAARELAVEPAGVPQQRAGGRPTRQRRPARCRLDRAVASRTRTRSPQRPRLPPHPPCGANDRRPARSSRRRRRRA